MVFVTVFELFFLLCLNDMKYCKVYNLRFNKFSKFSGIKVRVLLCNHQ